MNIKGAGADAAAVAADTVAKVNATGFSVTPAEMDTLAGAVKETSLFGRTGGAATLAVGMANIFSKLTQGRWLDLWYHFAIMFEALFILTTLDAGTRVGRYLLQDVLGHVWKPLGDTRSVRSNVIASLLVVAGWGYFLIQGVRDPLGGINSLWPLFGISNQLLAGVALCVGTTIIIKSGKLRYAWVTLVPLMWLLAVTLTAGWQKIFAADPRLGFLSHASDLAARMAAGAEIAGGARMIFNDRLNALLAGVFMLTVTALVISSAWQWVAIITRKKEAKLKEAPFVETAYAGSGS
jgi:carbon starvation protein